MLDMLLIIRSIQAYIVSYFPALDLVPKFCSVVVYAEDSYQLRK